MGLWEELSYLIARFRIAEDPDRPYTGQELERSTAFLSYQLPTTTACTPCTAHSTLCHCKGPHHSHALITASQVYPHSQQRADAPCLSSHPSSSFSCWSASRLRTPPLDSAHVARLRSQSSPPSFSLFLPRTHATATTSARRASSTCTCWPSRGRPSSATRPHTAAFRAVSNQLTGSASTSLCTACGRSMPTSRAVTRGHSAATAHTAAS